MKTGTIVYLGDAGALAPAADPEAAAAACGLDPAWTEVAASVPGYYRIEEALLELSRRGAGRIELVRARCGEGFGLTLSEPVRLAG